MLAFECFSFHCIQLLLYDLYKIHSDFGCILNPCCDGSCLFSPFVFVFPYVKKNGQSDTSLHNGYICDVYFRYIHNKCILEFHICNKWMVLLSLVWICGYCTLGVWSRFQDESMRVCANYFKWVFLALNYFLPDIILLLDKWRSTLSLTKLLNHLQSITSTFRWLK